MNMDEASTLFLDHCKPGDRGTLERYANTAATNAIVAVTAFLEDEARRYAGMYTEHSDGRNTFVIFANMIAELTADRVMRAKEQGL